MFTQVISLTKADMCEEIGIRKKCVCIYFSRNELKIHATIIIFNHSKQPANQPSSFHHYHHQLISLMYTYTQTAIMF